MRTSRSVVVLFALLTFGLPLTYSAQDLTQTNRQNSLLINTARIVLIEGVKVGLDEAGTRLLGPTAWRAFKQVLSPVVGMLQQQFPALSFGNPADERAAVAGREAANYLAHNAELQKLLVEKFDGLAEGQEEILSGITRLERFAEAGSQEHQELLKTSREILEEIKKLQAAGRFGNEQIEPPCTLQLVNPPDGTVLKVGYTEDGRTKIDQTFLWEACPEATQFHYYLKGDSVRTPLINKDNLRVPYYEPVFGVGDTLYEEDWTWMVRARVNGTWREWSEKRHFRLRSSD